MSIVIARGFVNQIEVFSRQDVFQVLGGDREDRSDPRGRVRLELEASEYRTDFRNLVRGEVKIVAVAADLEPSHDRVADANLILREARTMVDVAKDVVKKRQDTIDALACSAVTYGCCALARWASSVTPAESEDGWSKRARLLEIDR